MIIILFNFSLILRKYCKLGDLAHQVGWGKKDLVQKLEAKRQERASDYYTRKQTLERNISKEVESLKAVQKLRNELKQYGY